jgi:hypothetical protein
MSMWTDYRFQKVADVPPTDGIRSARSGGQQMITSYRS